MLALWAEAYGAVDEPQPLARRRRSSIDRPGGRAGGPRRGHLAERQPEQRLAVSAQRQGCRHLGQRSGDHRPTRGPQRRDRGARRRDRQGDRLFQVDDVKVGRRRVLRDRQHRRLSGPHLDRHALLHYRPVGTRGSPPNIKRRSITSSSGSRSPPGLLPEYPLLRGASPVPGGPRVLGEMEQAPRSPAQGGAVARWQHPRAVRPDHLPSAPRSSRSTTPHPNPPPPPHPPPPSQPQRGRVTPRPILPGAPPPAEGRAWPAGRPGRRDSRARARARSEELGLPVEAGRAAAPPPPRGPTGSSGHTSPAIKAQNGHGTGSSTTPVAPARARPPPGMGPRAPAGRPPRAHPNAAVAGATRHIARGRPPPPADRGPVPRRPPHPPRRPRAPPPPPPPPRPPSRPRPPPAPPPPGASSPKQSPQHQRWQPTPSPPPHSPPSTNGKAVPLMNDSPTSRIARSAMLPLVAGAWLLGVAQGEEPP